MKDAIDFAGVTLLNSPDVRDWPITTEITRLGLPPGQLAIEFTKQDEWPPVRFETAEQQATVWIFLQADGQWFGGAVERLRPGQRNKPERAPVGEMLNEWFVHANWEPMASHKPHPFEPVGWMVTAGNQRLGQDFVVKERSAIVLTEWPDGRGEPDLPIVRGDEPAPAPTPSPPAADPVHDGDMERLVDAADRIVDAMELIYRAVLALCDRLEELRKEGVRIRL
jgi:hypothetical protein